MKVSRVSTNKSRVLEAQVPYNELKFAKLMQHCCALTPSADVTKVYKFSRGLDFAPIS